MIYTTYDVFKKKSAIPSKEVLLGLISRLQETQSNEEGMFEVNSQKVIISSHSPYKVHAVFLFVLKKLFDAGFYYLPYTDHVENINCISFSVILQNFCSIADLI
jgi:hypothetical protein